MWGTGTLKSPIPLLPGVMSQTNASNHDAMIMKIADGVGVPDDVADFAVQLYGEVSKPDGDGNLYIDGGYVDRGIPATVYAAVRIRGLPIKPREIAEQVDDPDVGPRRIMRDTKRLLAILPFDVSIDGSERRFVERYCDDLGVGEQFTVTALSVCDDAVEAELHVGRAPSVVAAAVIYATSRLLNADVDQRDVADVAGVSVRVIRDRYRDVIDVASGFTSDDRPTHADLSSIVDGIIDGLGSVPDVVEDDAHAFADAINPDADWVRRCDPRAVAAACVYVAAKDNRIQVTQADAGEPVGISRHAVNARSQDLREWNARRDSLDDHTYNRLKELAAEHGVDVGPTPAREYVIARLADAGVSG